MSNVIDLMPYIDDKRAMDNFKQAEVEYDSLLECNKKDIMKNYKGMDWDAIKDFAFCSWRDDWRAEHADTPRK